MPKSDFLVTNILNHVLRNTPYSPPTTVYVALFTVAPTSVAASGTEVAGGAYVRQPVTFAAPASHQTISAADVLFPVATADWGEIVAFATFDQPSLGNMLYFSTLAAHRTILTDDQFRFPAGQLIATED
jgi:hypothetical protein